MVGRRRSRSMSQSQSPPRSRSRTPDRRNRNRYDAPSSRYRNGGGFRPRFSRYEAPTGLLVRNIALETRTEDIRSVFERFGPLKDVYLPKNFHTGVRRGFGFVKFQHGDDAAMAKQEMQHKVIDGREITILFADEKRKTPIQMRNHARISDRYDGRRVSYHSRSPRQRYRSYSRSRSASPSPSPRRDSRERGRHRDRDALSPSSISPSPDRRAHSPSNRSPLTDMRAHSPDQRRASPASRSPPHGRSPLTDMRAHSPDQRPSPARHSPPRGRSPAAAHRRRSSSPSRSRSYSPR